MRTKTQVCIIDDEQDGRDYISLLLKNEFPDLHIAFQAESVKDAFMKLTKEMPDIIFLDVQLTDGNAFDLLSRFRNFSSQIIFITAYDHFAIMAIKNGATDYLLKPIDEVDFVAAVTKALENIRKNKTHSFNTTIRSKINLPTLQGFKSIDIADIVRCEADANYTTFYLSDKTKMVVSKNLKEFEGPLVENDFFRIHNKHLINLKHFKEYIKGKGGQVIMSDNSVLDVSVRKKQEFMEVLQLWG
ncbi:two-component system LytT family response regulator [Chryseobacterium defluvii]|uniref:Two-component system LytT family response regulator n=1 Tax=Chryseobacterium defluvii TaxID=160396 RepID=A0A840KF61_9FLAO|nr:LytTR family DNA-binding domain-containing protein [Chryseobacterium defluvii]MBB4807826.1 two-component system LytT family response regulator [Chryseobacterium defluvii]